MPTYERPELVLVSPYVRAVETARSIQTEGGLATASSKLIVDGRLREQGFGILEPLTRAGVDRHYPEQAQIRRMIGKFRHRPPAGESWSDVGSRARGVLETIEACHAGKRILIVGHQVVVLCLRYLIEQLSEEQILEIDAMGEVANCAVTEYALVEARGTCGKLILVRYNFVVPIQQ